MRSDHARAATPRRWRTATEQDTERLGESLAPELLPSGVLLLHGELGSGKTVLVRGLARGLGIPAGEVQSPTFTLMREHRGPHGRLLHVDLYRIEPAQVEAIGLEELLAGPGVKVVEWAERLPFAVAGALALVLRRLPAGGREIFALEAGAGAAPHPATPPLPPSAAARPS